MRYTLLLFPIIALISLASVQAHACSCMMSSKDNMALWRTDREMHEIQKYQIVFTGKLVETKTDSGVLNSDIVFNPRDPQDFISYGGITYTFEVQKQWKGPSLPAKVSIYQSRDDFSLPSGCSVKFHSEKKYLIYADIPDEKGILSYAPAAYCSPTQELSSAKIERLQLLDQVEKEGFDEVLKMREGISKKLSSPATR